MKINDQVLVDYLEERLEESDHQQVAIWLKSEENLMQFQATERIWKAAKNARIFESVSTENAKERVKGSLYQTKKRGLARRIDVSYIAKIAASIIVVLGMGIAFYLFQENSKWITIQAGEVARAYELPDGSHVTLNRNTELKIAKDLSERRSIQLVGEAFFEVKRDEVVPFEVSVGDILVKVLGTSFNIKENSTAVAVNVASGKVEVTERDNHSNRQVLIAGESTVFSQTQKQLERSTSESNFLAWKTGKYSFQDTPLVEALELMAENRNIKIHFSNKEAMKECTITAVFEEQSWSEILQELGLITSLKFQEVDGRTNISGQNCQ